MENHIVAWTYEPAHTCRESVPFTGHKVVVLFRVCSRATISRRVKKRHVETASAVATRSRKNEPLSGRSALYKTPAFNGQPRYGSYPSRRCSSCSNGYCNKIYFSSANRGRAASPITNRQCFETVHVFYRRAGRNCRTLQESPVSARATRRGLPERLTEILVPRPPHRIDRLELAK